MRKYIFLTLLFSPMINWALQDQNTEYKIDVDHLMNTQKDTVNNVLFIIVDDLSNTLGCYGMEEVITPNLDGLADRGLLFNRAYSQVSLCNPSRASILTGKRPNNLKIWNNTPHFRGLHPKIKTLPEHFKDNGFYTVGIGKIFHNWVHPIQGDPQSWSESQTYHWGPHYSDWYVPGQPFQLHTQIPKGPAIQSVDVMDEAYLDGRIANAAVNKLRELSQTSFFLAVGFWKPHLPFNAPKKYWDLYDRNSLPKVDYPRPVEAVPELAYVDSKEARSYTDVSKKGEISEAKQRELRHGYLAAISYLDAQVGKVLDELDQLGLTDKTTIVFVSDHGYHAGEHGQFGKWTNFEIGTRVPLIISAPGITQPGTTSNSIIELVDLFPTLLELHGLPSLINDNKLDGLSLVPLLEDPALKLKSVAISQISRPLGAGVNIDVLGSTIRDESYRYTAWKDLKSNEIIEEEFYNLSNGPFKIDNQIRNPVYSPKIDSLQYQLFEILKN